jgi:filamentous hemagglutinin
MATVKRTSGNLTFETVSPTGQFTFVGPTANAATVVIDGNLTVTGNAALTGNIAGDKIFNGTTAIEIPVASGNANVTIGGTANVLVLSTGGANITGYTTSTGNITGANLITAGLITSTGNITGGNINTAGNIFITRNAVANINPTIRFTDSNATVTDGTVLGSVEWFTSDASPGARVTAAIRATAAGTTGNANVAIFTSTNGAAATAKVTVLSTGNVGIANAAPNDTLAVTGTIYGSSTASLVGNVQGGNLRTAGQVSATGNITGGNVIFNSGIISGTGNISGGNLISAGLITAGTTISAAGNITGGNITSNDRISAVGNITGANLVANFNLSAVSNVIAGNASITSNVTTSNIVVSSSMTGGGLGVENFVYQATDATLSSATPATIGSLQFNAVANQAYQFTAYITLVPVGATTVAPAVNFSSGSCNYITQLQTTSTSAFNIATKTASDDVATTYASTGTDARTLIISGWFSHTANTTVSMRFQTSAANVTAKTGSYLSYTRIY